MKRVAVDAPTLGFVKGFAMQAVEVKSDFAFASKGETKHGINIMLSTDKVEVVVNGGNLAACAVRNPDAFDITDEGLLFHEELYNMGGAKGQILVELKN